MLNAGDVGWGRWNECGKILNCHFNTEFYANVCGDTIFAYIHTYTQGNIVKIWKKLNTKDFFVLLHILMYVGFAELY